MTNAAAAALILVFMVSAGATAGELTPLTGQPRENVVRHGAFWRYDVAILGGRVMDPETGFDQIANVGISDGRIAVITSRPLRGKREIQARGLVVSPGFIDLCVAGRPGSARTARNIEAWKVSDGVTTVLFLHDGTGDMPRFKRVLLGEKHYANIGFSTRVWDYLYRGYTLDTILGLIQDNLDQGALGVSVSPEYTPDLTYEQMLAFAQLAADNRVPFFMHLRYSSSDRELEGVEEAVMLAEESGVHLHIFHLPSTGGTYRMDAALDLIRWARLRGARIDADLYSYTYWATYINAARFNRGWQERYRLDYGDLFYVPTREYLTRETFNHYRKKGGLIVVPEGTMSLERSVIPALREDFVYIASDSACEVPFGGRYVSVGHPRATNNSARALALGRGAGIALMSMLHKLTLGPAELMKEAQPSFKLRGRLQEGCIADITVFDYLSVDGKGTVLNRAVPSEGIRYVLVGGRVVYDDGSLGEPGSGEFLLRPSFRE
jgi:N-acyl-D-aspartate/D-glutamate deacylase